MSTLPLLILSLVSSVSPVAAATRQTSPPEVDRLHHAPGTVTGKAGLAAVERRGHGPVQLLLIAGAPFGWHAWEDFMSRNVERYTMLAVTPAGYDGTPPPAMPAPEHEDYGERAWTEALMTDLVALLEKERSTSKLGPPIVVGHHLMGDYYAVRLAYEHPELVRAVVSVAGQGSVSVGRGGADAEARLRYVRDDRAPFFRTVSQGTWNASTFRAEALSKDAERGRRLYEAQIAIPLATQLRYYLEYMTDDLEPGMEFVQCPVLALEAPPMWGFENLSDSMKDQLVRKFGSLEEAKKQVSFGGPWKGLSAKANAGLVRVVDVPGAGIFMMDDVPEAFDRALFEFADEVVPDRK